MGRLHGVLDAMHITFSRLVAAISLAVGGALTGLTAFGLSVAGVVVGSGRVQVLAADAKTIHEMSALAPVVGALGVLAFVAAVLLSTQASRARATGIAVAAAGVAVAAGLAGLVLSAAGPFAALPSDRVVDGLGIVGTYAAFNLVALIGLIADRGVRPTTGASAAA